MWGHFRTLFLLSDLVIPVPTQHLDSWRCSDVLKSRGTNLPKSVSFSKLTYISVKFPFMDFTQQYFVVFAVELLHIFHEIYLWLFVCVCVGVFVWDSMLLHLVLLLWTWLYSYFCWYIDRELILHIDLIFWYWILLKLLGFFGGGIYCLREYMMFLLYFVKLVNYFVLLS